MSSVEREMESAGFGNANLYYVRVRVPQLGFGTSLDEIIQFYWERGEELRAGYFDKSDESHSIYFCFCDAENADDFAKHFNGEQFRFPFASAMVSEVAISDWTASPLADSRACKK